MLEMLNCILNGRTATREKRNIAIESHDHFQRYTNKRFIGRSGKVFIDRWEDDTDLNKGWVLVHLGCLAATLKTIVPRSEKLARKYLEGDEGSCRRLQRVPGTAGLACT